MRCLYSCLGWICISSPLTRINGDCSLQFFNILLIRLAIFLFHVKNHYSCKALFNKVGTYAIFSLTVKVVVSSLLSTNMSPSDLSTIVFAMDKPKPKPPVSWDLEASGR